MKKSLIIERLAEVVVMLKELENKQFDFNDYIVDQKNGCGTVCCALGWMPRYMPQVGLRWIEEGGYITLGSTSSPGGTDIDKITAKYLGVSEFVVFGLFFAGQDLDLKLTKKGKENLEGIIDLWAKKLCIRSNGFYDSSERIALYASRGSINKSKLIKRIKFVSFMISAGYIKNYK